MGFVFCHEYGDGSFCFDDLPLNSQCFLLDLSYKEGQLSISADDVSASLYLLGVVLYDVEWICLLLNKFDLLVSDSGYLLGLVGSSLEFH